jgi:hypothetical protein
LFGVNLQHGKIFVLITTKKGLGYSLGYFLRTHLATLFLDEKRGLLQINCIHGAASAAAAALETESFVYSWQCREQ